MQPKNVPKIVAKINLNHVPALESGKDKVMSGLNALKVTFGLCCWHSFWGQVALLLWDLYAWLC
ncbi:hypothetical protein LguiA_021314 [Lonicera macranthoides]